jgi:outer membrane protein TolC
VLRLEDATVLALRSDPRIQAALAKVRVVQAEAHQSRLLPNPVLTVAIRFAQSGGQPALEANLAADLLAVLQRPGRVSAADKRLRAAAAEALGTVVEVWGDVQERYLAVQAAQARVQTLQESDEVTGRYLSLADARLRVGEAIRLDVSSLRAQQLDFQLQLADARLDVRRERLALARLLGRPSDAAVFELMPLSDLVLAPPDESSIVAAALAQRSELQAKVWELRALGADARLARWYLLDGVVPGIDAEHDPDWGVGPSLEVPLPIFDWGQARRARADAQVSQAGHELLGARRQVVQEVRTALATVEQSIATLRRARDELIPLQRQRREDAEAAYRAGQSDATGLLLAERDLQDDRARYTQLQQQAHSALIQLQRAAGGPAVLTAVPTTAPATAPAIP